MDKTFAPLSVIGLGPGDTSFLSPEAQHCIRSSQVIVGYTGYIDLVEKTLLTGKELISTNMMGEIARSKAAISSAQRGKATTVICSGDPGIYALAGLILEIIEQDKLFPEDFPLRIIPGIPAVCAAAALLGAPLTHDFACISLSNLLTPSEVILQRLEHAFAGDFVTVLYNPRSKKRQVLLEKALNSGGKYRDSTTPVGIVRNAFRKNQEVTIATLNSIDTSIVDMFTILIIGNSTTRIVAGSGEMPLQWNNGARILTPRGYKQKYDI